MIIGANSIIFPNVIVGEGTAVGAMSMVKESLDDWYIYAGIPVRKVKPRQKKMLELEIDFKKHSFLTKRMNAFILSRYLPIKIRLVRAN